jgi:hypothetical protein
VCKRTVKLLLLLLVVVSIVPGTAQVGAEGMTPQAPKIETTYNSCKNETTVRMEPMQISRERGLYHSLHVAPAYSFAGQVPRPPETIDFELQSVVKARKLRIDLYVLFVIDGEKIFLSSSRGAVKRPVPRRSWIGERLVFRMPYQTLIKLGNAKKASIRMDRVDFGLSADHLRALRLFAETGRPKLG